MAIGERSIGDWADDVARMLERAADRAGRMIEPTLRLGVTGLSRAGKTLFVASLAANLLRRGRMQGLSAVAEGRVEAVLATPQPDMDAPRFELERHLADLAADPPRWPESTRAVAQLRLSIRYRPARLLGRLAGALTGAATLHLDLVDYPGEWLLDLGLLELDYARWSEQALARAGEGPERAALAADALAWARQADAARSFDEVDARAGAAAFTAYLRAAKAAGFSDLAPGRFLLPGDLEGAPALTFAPLPPEATRAARRGSLAAEFERRYDAYKHVVARPFFRAHFARLDRQIVLVDALGAAAAGPERAADAGRALTTILSAFRTGDDGPLGALLGRAVGRRRIDRLLLAVTRADCVHHTAHGRLTALARDLLAQGAARAAYSGATVEALAIAAIRATVEDEIRRGGERLPAVRGRLLDDAAGREALLFPGEPPASLAEMLRGWSSEAFLAPRLAPPRLGAGGVDDGPPHIRLDRALEFLIGDRLA